MGVIGMLCDSPDSRVSFQVEDGIMRISSSVFIDKMTQFSPGTPFNNIWRQEIDGKTHVQCSIYLADCDRRDVAINTVRLNVLADNLNVSGPIVWHFVYQKIEKDEMESQLEVFTTETNFSLIA